MLEISAFSGYLERRRITDTVSSKCSEKALRFGALDDHSRVNCGIEDYYIYRMKHALIFLRCLVD